MSSNALSPVKKPRGIPGKKRKTVETDIVTTEFTDEQVSIEQELIKHRLGSVKVYVGDMTFKWKDGENRSLANPTKSASLKKKLKEGLFRFVPENRLSGCLSRTAFTESLYHPDTERKFSDAEIKSRNAKINEYNQQAKFPVLKLDSTTKIEMQSGQHRMALLQQLRTSPKDHYWIVTIYDDRNCLIYYTNLLELPLIARTNLRRNERNFAVPETEAEIFLQLRDFERQMTQAKERHSSQVKSYEYMFERSFGNLATKAKQFYKCSEYRAFTWRILEAFPGLRNDFRCSGYEQFMTSRTVEVIALVCTLLISSSTNIF